VNESFGTNDEITAAIEKHADMVRRICFLYLRNRADVEDVFQEVFLKFFLNIDSLQDEAHRKAWLCPVTFNQCKDVCKGFWRRKVVSREGMEIPFENPEQGELIGAVLTLPPDLKELVYLHYFEGRTVPEVADIMEKNPNTVYSMLRRAKSLLKQKAGEFE
jgi:RNA polymerase sigma-70 factor (ECF subfamily)